MPFIMHADAKVHVVLDANVIVAGISHKGHKSEVVRSRARVLLDAVVTNRWPLLSLYTPSICVAEAQCTFDRLFYCKWHGEGKDRSRRLTRDEYAAATLRLANLTANRLLQRIDISPEHISLLPVISSVNCKHQVRRRSKVDTVTGKGDGSRIRPPMGTADCLIGTVAIELASRLGVDSVILITADGRLHDVFGRCRAKAHDPKDNFVKELVKRLELDRHVEVIPNAIHLSRATDSELLQYLKGWPLPSRRTDVATLDVLSPADKITLYTLGQEIKQTSGVGPDSLPYSIELDQLQIRFADATGYYVTKADIAKQLLSWRKNPSSRPGVS